MRGVTFDNVHSYNAWRLMLKSAPEISPPEPKTYYVDILGAHGQMDLSEALAGKVLYNNRKIKLEFIYAEGRNEWTFIYYGQILNELHGKVKTIKFDDDPFSTYKGRVTVGTPDVYKGCITLPVTVECEPFVKYMDGSERL